VLADDSIRCYISIYQYGEHKWMQQTTVEKLNISLMRFYLDAGENQWPLPLLLPSRDLYLQLAYEVDGRCAFSPKSGEHSINSTIHRLCQYSQ